VTPVARRITYAEKDGFIFGAGFGERLFSPGKPIHRVVGVLDKIRRGGGR
jgi:hypothetical protein